MEQRNILGLCQEPIPKDNVHLPRPQEDQALRERIEAQSLAQHTTHHANYQNFYLAYGSPYCNLATPRTSPNCQPHGNKSTGIAASHNSDDINTLRRIFIQYSEWASGHSMQPGPAPDYSVAKHNDSKNSRDNILHLDIFVTNRSDKNIINYFKELVKGNGG